MSSAPDPLPKATNVRYIVLAWACSLSMITYIDRICIKRMQGPMSDDLGFTTQQFGWVMSSFFLAYALFEVPSGWMGDWIGPRKVLARIVLWWSVFTVLTGMVWRFEVDLGFSIPWIGGWVPVVFNSLILMILIRFLFGMGEAGAYPNIARALRNWFPYQRRGTAQGVVWMFARWGGAIAPALISLFSIWLGWRGAFFAFGVIGAIWVVLFLLFFRDTPRDHPRVNAAELEFIQGPPRSSSAAFHPAISWRSMFRSPTLWLLSLMYCGSNAGWCFFITWDEMYYRNVLKLTGTGLSVASGSPLFFGGIACIMGGLLTDRMVRVLGRRWGRTFQGFLAYFLGASFFLAAMLVEHPVWTVLFLCIASFVKDFAMGVSWATCIDVGHRYSGSVSGFMNMIGNLGSFFATPFVAWLAQKGDWRLALLFSASMFLFAAASWLFINPRRVIVYTQADLARLQHEGAL